MLTISADTVLLVVGGELIAGSLERVAADVCVDSRLVTPGCMFVALPGETVDGHQFAEPAVDDGARIILVSRSAADLGPLVSAAETHGATIVRVDDTTTALQRLAAYHRSRIHCEVLGITGSSGKTSTKDFVMAALGTVRRVVGTLGNQNNELGVPLTVLAADANTDILVVEMGMRGLGQIAALCEIAHPTLALITNVGTSHIELLGTQDAVAEAKGELVRCLPLNGVAFLNGDDHYSDRIEGMTSARVVRYGLSDACEVRGVDIELDADSRPSFTLVAAGDSVRVQLPVPGRHNVYNALAAAAVAVHLGVSPSETGEGLSQAHLTDMRMQVVCAAGGTTVINDAYNANPASMRAAIDTLAAMAAEGQRIAVLGDMAELGSLTELAHFRIGEAVHRLGIDRLVTVGPRARRIAEGAAADGMPPGRISSFESPVEAILALEELATPDDVVLVKASRVMGLESIVDALVGQR